MEPTTTRLSRPDPVGRRACPASSPRAFTLAELLVVIGIMIVLMALLLPMLSKARANAQRVSIASDLVGIAQALDQYKHDWGDYPRTSTDKPSNVQKKVVPPPPGGVVLCWALIAPGPASQDGAGQQVASGGTDMGAPGFRPFGLASNPNVGAPQYQGKVYGPYLNVEKYRYGRLGSSAAIGSPALNLTPPGVPVDDTDAYIADSLGNAILYFPGITNVVPGQGSPPAALVGQDAIGQPLNAQSPHHVYNYNDNAPPLLSSAMVQPMCSLTPNILNIQLGANTPNPVIKPFILISAGHDGRFGPSLNNGAAAGDDDDVAYPDVLAPVPVGTTP